MDDNQQFTVPGAAPQPELTPTPLATPPPEKKPVLRWVLIALAVILLVGGGTFAALYFFGEKADNTPEAQEPSPTRVLINDLKAKMTTELEQYDDLTIESVDAASSPARKASSGNYYYRGEGGYELLVRQANKEVIDEAFAADVETSTKKVMTEAGLSETLAAEVALLYQSDEFVCEVSRGISPISIRCADAASYGDAESKIAPFAEAFFKNETEQTGAPSFGLPAITERSNGASSATVSVNSMTGIGGWAQLFYKTSDTWVSWKGTQAVLACEDYNTAELKKSFEGDVCFTADGNESTVKVD